MATHGPLEVGELRREVSTIVSSEPLLPTVHPLGVIVPVVGVTPDHMPTAQFPRHDGRVTRVPTESLPNHEPPDVERDRDGLGEGDHEGTA
jgi:hypothetical protein